MYNTSRLEERTMKNQNGWTEFRKKRFYERQEYLRNKSLYEEWNNIENENTPKTIAVLLDLDGTCDFIDDEKAKEFLNQLEIIRKKFRADYGTISISTHYGTPERIKPVLDILSRNTTKNIKIGLNFYYGGIYDYEQDSITMMESNFNADKVSTFEDYYIHGIGYNNQWFAVIDDSISKDTYKRYQYSHLMFLCRPSQTEYGTNNNCFMSYATETNGFDGVIEGFNIYIDSIKKLSKEQVLETQKNMMTHISSHELINKIRERNYEFIERYFKEGYADEADYRDVIVWIGLTNKNQKPTKKELQKIRRILEIISENLALDGHEDIAENIKKLTKNIDIPKN